MHSLHEGAASEGEHEVGGVRKWTGTAAADVPHAVQAVLQGVLVNIEFFRGGLEGAVAAEIHFQIFQILVIKACKNFPDEELHCLL